MNETAPDSEKKKKIKKVGEKNNNNRARRMCDGNATFLNRCGKENRSFECVSAVFAFSVWFQMAGKIYELDMTNERTINNLLLITRMSELVFLHFQILLTTNLFQNISQISFRTHSRDVKLISWKVDLRN